MKLRRAGVVLVATMLVACVSRQPPPPVYVPPAVAPVEPKPPSEPIETNDAPLAKPSANGLASPAETALQEWSKRTQCPDFDYFPNGGIRNFWCHRPQRLTVTAVRTLAGVDIFSSGPHSKDELVLDSANAFGHYNPAFVRWLVDNVAPSPRGSAVQHATQASYDANLKPLAEIFWRTLEKARADPACWERERSQYADAIARKKLPKDYYERWFYFMNPHFCERPKKSERFMMDNGFDNGVDGNVTKTVVGFWLRRQLDGTMDTFAEGLKKVIASYQPELLGP